jgi:hypothetical protein
LDTLLSDKSWINSSLREINIFFNQRAVSVIIQIFSIVCFVVMSNLIFNTVRSESFKQYAQHAYLSYYALLAVYAICNLLVLMLGFGFQITHAIPLAIMLTVGAFINELINMKTVTNPLSSQSKNVRPSIITIIISAFVWALSLIDSYATLTSMVNVQLMMLSQLQLAVPIHLAGLYQSLFLVSGLSAQAMTSATNLVTALTNQFTALPDNKQQKPHKKHTPSNGLIDRLISTYLKNQYLFPIGVCIGAFLYANGDYQALFGLLYFASQSQLLALSMPTISILSMLYGVSTFCERILLWGYNFRRYEQDHEADFSSTNSRTDYKQFHPFHYIPNSSTMRSLFSTWRIGVSGIRSIIASACLFNGWYRVIGIAASVSSVRINYVQTRFQMQSLPDHTEEASLHKQQHAM